MLGLKKIAGFLPGALLYAVISILSQQSTFPIEEPFSGFDKIVHVSEFAALGAALAFGLFRGRAFAPGGRLFRESVFLWFAGACLGFLDEFHQMFVAGRHPDLADAAVDALGVGLGIGLFVVLRRRRSRL